MRLLVDKKNDRDIANCGLDDAAIRQAMKDIASGVIHADLGGGLIKQRIARGNRGKSKGCRGLIVIQSEEILILVHVFAKSDKANILAKEKKALLGLAKVLRAVGPDEIMAMAAKEKWRMIEDAPEE